MPESIGVFGGVVPGHSLQAAPRSQKLVSIVGQQLRLT